MDCKAKALLAMGLLCGLMASELTEDFYSSSCPNAEAIIVESIAASASQSNVVPIAVLRLFAHDCFVEGCDASILISSTSTNSAELDFPDNQNFPPMPFDAVIQAKHAVEAICPGVVSCADILAISAREGVVLSGGPSWPVLKGRRDGLVSQASRTVGHLPGSNFSFQQLVTMFSQMNLTVEDLVALTGAHTIGFAHCDQFVNRLYTFNSSSGIDPSINSQLVIDLQTQCPLFASNPTTIQAIDVKTPFSFDNAFFQNLQQGQGVLFSDQVLYSDPISKDLVDQYATDQDVFFKAFVEAMEKLSSVGVKTGSDGEIRRDCTTLNNPL